MLFASSGICKRSCTRKKHGIFSLPKWFWCIPLGIYRRYILQGTPLTKVTEEELSKAVYLVNNRPRKSLGFQTATEVFSHGSLPFKHELTSVYRSRMYYFAFLFLDVCNRCPKQLGCIAVASFNNRRNLFHIITAAGVFKFHFDSFFCSVFKISDVQVFCTFRY